jgi:hypothetical protein
VNTVLSITVIRRNAKKLPAADFKIVASHVIPAVLNTNPGGEVDITFSFPDRKTLDIELGCLDAYVIINAPGLRVTSKGRVANQEAITEALHQALGLRFNVDLQKAVHVETVKAEHKKVESAVRSAKIDLAVVQMKRGKQERFRQLKDLERDLVLTKLVRSRDPRAIEAIADSVVKVAS